MTSYVLSTRFGCGLQHSLFVLSSYSLCCSPMQSFRDAHKLMVQSGMPENRKFSTPMHSDTHSLRAAHIILFMNEKLLKDSTLAGYSLEILDVVPESMVRITTFFRLYGTIPCCTYYTIPYRRCIAVGLGRVQYHSYDWVIFVP